MTSQNHLNIVIYITHDTGRHLGCYGMASVATPSMDRIAAEGVLFTRHFCTAPQCTPSRAAIFTGRYPHSNGVMGLAGLGYLWSLPQSEKHMARFFKEAGYETILFGNQHEVDFSHIEDCAGQLGYERHVGPKPFATVRELSPLIADEMRALGKAKRDRPFFICIGSSETHRHFDRPEYEPDDPATVRVPPFLPDGPESRGDLAKFHGSVKQADRLVGEVLDLLDETGLSGNTLFIYTTDHGIPYFGAKMTLYDPGLEAALIFRGPGEFGGGKVVNEMLSNIDMLPTLLERIGISLPDNVQGRTFLPLLREEYYKPRTEIFGEKTYHGCYDPMRCIRTERFKYIRYWKPDQPHEDGGEGKVTFEGKNIADLPPQTRPAEELFDLGADPVERNNLARSTDHAPTLEEMRQRLLAHLEATDDPILKGPIPAPKGSKDSQ